MENSLYDFNFVLKEAGQFGIFQKLLVFIAYLATIPGASNLVADIFFAYGEEPARCKLQIDDNNTVSVDQVIQYYIPTSSDQGSLSRCTKFEAEKCDNRTDVTCMKELYLNGSLTNVTSCKDGYIHARSTFEETITTEWDLICAKEKLRSLSMTMFCFGLLVGAICGGYFADRFGRKKTWFLSTALAGTFGCFCSLSPNIYIFVLFRFLIGAFVSSIILCVTTHSTEFVGERYRPFVGLQLGIFSGIGYINLGLLAYKLRNWRRLQLVLGCLFFPFLFVIPFIPESPRFLFQSGRSKRGKKVCNMISRVNTKHKLDDFAWEKARMFDSDEDCTKPYSPLKLFTKLPLLKMLLSCIVLNFTTSLVFFFLSFNVGSWFGDPFLNQVLSGLVELVACILAIPAASYFGRRTINVVCMAVPGTLLIISQVMKIVLVDQPWVKPAEVGILLVAKLTGSPAFNLLFMYIAELFPTSLRSTAGGLANTGSRLAGVLSPLILAIPRHLHVVVTISVGVLALLVAVLAYFCPETKGKPMITSVEEAIRFYKTGELKHLVEAEEINNNNNDGDWSSKTEENSS